jgi:hypothetical protein
MTKKSKRRKSEFYNLFIILVEWFGTTRRRALSSEETKKSSKQYLQFLKSKKRMPIKMCSGKENYKWNWKDQRQSSRNLREIRSSIKKTRNRAFEINI